ncbi:alpha-hydroxy-acid oxidizing protein [Streptomyces sp.]|uniref:alpha-hydroxy-acid oxidizing protein n=1 Tax=Streptomyces sp. TaxID=1931 RepID=UPI0025E2ACE7|nr:alpha-hydroxy-acid oxidizing protein [Streptomyces sp.]
MEGGPGEERTLCANTEAYDRLWLHPGVLTDAGTPVIATRILGRHRATCATSARPGARPARSAVCLAELRQ